MNKRYKELEKKATDTRGTYERLVCKVDKFLKHRLLLEKQLERAILLHDIAKKKCEQGYPVEQYKELNYILTNYKTVTDLGFDYHERLRKQTNKLSEQHKQYEEQTNLAYSEVKELDEQIDELEREFNEGFRKNDIIDENVTMKLFKLEKQRNKLVKKRSDLLYKAKLTITKRDRVKDDMQKVVDKCTEYINQLQERCDKLGAFRMRYNIDFDDEFELSKSMREAYKEVKRFYSKTTDKQQELDEHNKQLDQLKFKLSMAKEKMEEAEYQFKEYKGMIGAA